MSFAAFPTFDWPNSKLTDAGFDEFALGLDKASKPGIFIKDYDAVLTAQGWLAYKSKITEALRQLWMLPSGRILLEYIAATTTTVIIPEVPKGFPIKGPGGITLAGKPVVSRNTGDVCADYLSWFLGDGKSKYGHHMFPPNQCILPSAKFTNVAKATNGEAENFILIQPQHNNFSLWQPCKEYYNGISSPFGLLDYIEKLKGTLDKIEGDWLADQQIEVLGWVDDSVKKSGEVFGIKVDPSVLNSPSYEMYESRLGLGVSTVVADLGMCAASNLVGGRINKILESTDLLPSHMSWTIGHELLHIAKSTSTNVEFQTSRLGACLGYVAKYRKKNPAMASELCKESVLDRLHCYYLSSRVRYLSKIGADYSTMPQQETEKALASPPLMDIVDWARKITGRELLPANLLAEYLLEDLCELEAIEGLWTPKSSEPEQLVLAMSENKLREESGCLAPFFYRRGHITRPMRWPQSRFAVFPMEGVQKLGPWFK